MSYQETLQHRRESTNIVTSSYTIKYRGFYIHGANYNGQHICYVSQGFLHYYSKSLESVKRKIRAYHKTFNL